MIKFKLSSIIYYIAIALLTFSSLVLVYTNNSAYKICIVFVFILLIIVAIYMHRKKLHVNAYFISFLMFSIWSMLSILWCDRKFSYNLILVFCYISLIIFGLINCLETEREMLILIKAIILASLVLVIYILSFYGIDALTSSRMDNELLNSNRAGRISAIASFLSIWMRYRTGNVFYLCSWGVLMIMAFLSGSKSALVNIIVLNIVFLLLKDGKRQGKKIKNIILAFLFCTIVLYCIQNVSFLYNIIGERFLIFWNGLFGKSTGYAGHSTMMRTYFMQTGLEMFMERPIVGYGLDMFRYHNIYNTYAHSNFIELAADLGIIGLILYYAPYFLILQKLVKKKKCIDPLWYALGMAFIINTAIDSFTSLYFNVLSDYLLPIILYCYITRTIQRNKNEKNSKSIYKMNHGALERRNYND